MILAGLRDVLVHEFVVREQNLSDHALRWMHLSSDNVMAALNWEAFISLPLAHRSAKWSVLCTLDLISLGDLVGHSITSQKRQRQVS